MPRVARVFPPASAFAAMLALDAYTKKFRRFNGALRSMIELYLGPSILVIPQTVFKVWCSYFSNVNTMSVYWTLVREPKLVDLVIWQEPKTLDETHMSHPHL